MFTIIDGVLFSHLYTVEIDKIDEIEKNLCMHSILGPHSGNLLKFCD